MIGLDKLVAGILLSLAALCGLFIAAHARDGAFGFFGYLLFLFAVLMLFRFVALVIRKEDASS